jgi:hypothetical protein
MTTREIADRLQEAAAAVALADLPQEFRALAYERALDAVGLRCAISRAPDPSPPEEVAAGVVPSSLTEGGQLELIASRLELPIEAVERVYEADENDGLRLILKRAMLPRPEQKAASMRDVALLVTVGRQAAGLEEYTSFAMIRSECQDLRVLDGSNFSAEVAKLEMRRRGGRNNQEAKANRHHYEDTAELINEIVSKSAAA